MLSLHRGLHGGRLLRVTKLDQDAWRAMLKRMQEHQGSRVSLAGDRQAEALAEISVTTTTVERPLDRRTATLLERLWRALIGRAQVVHSDVATLDGVGYYLSNRRIAGSTANPPYGSVLQRATFAAEWLSRLVETPTSDDEADLRHIREEMSDALERTRHNEPCVRPYRQ
jgi:hypothetical protein